MNWTPEVEANQRLRDELEEELRAKIQARAALDGGMTPPDGDDEMAAPAGELETSPTRLPVSPVSCPPPRRRYGGGAGAIERPFQVHAITSRDDATGPALRRRRGRARSRQGAC